MSKGILGPTVVTLCLGCIGGFHCLKSMRRSSYDDANKSVGELLVEKEKFQLVSSLAEQDSVWDQIINKYKENSITDKERFERAPKDDNELKEKLKEECKQLSEKANKSISINIYNKARRWCVVPQTTKKRLELEGRVALKQQDKEGWESIAEQIKGKEITSFGIKKETETKDAIEAFKKGCEPILESQNWDKEFDTNFEKAKRYCSVRN